MDNNTLYTILQRYFKALSYTGYVQLQDLQYLIVLVYINDIQEYIDQSIIDKALEIIKSKCIFYNNSFDIEDQEYCPIKDNTYSIDFFNINLSSDKVKLNIGQGSNIKSVTIPSATQSLAGVLSSNDKVVIGKINEAIDQNILIGGLSTQQSADTISIGYSQMNPDSSFEDIHINLPLATQSKAGLLSKEDKYIIDNVRSDIAEAGITSFTKTATPNNVTLTLQSANSGFSVQLNRANLGEAGLVLGTDIDTINKANNLLTSYRPLVDEINVTPTENTVELEYLYYDGNDQSVYSYDVELPAATTTTAGIMTASDKSIVNNANTLLSNSPLVDKLQFAVSDNKRWLQYKNNGNSLFTGISMPIFGEKIQVIADYESTGSTNCSINLLALDDSVISSTNIPVVNERHNGVMSASIYTDWLQVKELADQLWNTTINTFDVGYNLDSVDVSLLTNGGDPIEANIEAATTTTAGVMSAEDKQQLTNVVSEMPTISDNIDAIVGALPKVTDTFEGAYDNKGLLYVVRKNKLIAILKDSHVEYAPEGVAYVDAIAPTSFSIGNKVYNVPAGITYVELGLTTPITSNDMYQKVLYQNTGIRGFGLYLDGSKNTSLGQTFAEAADLEWFDISGMDTKAVTYGFAICAQSPILPRIYGKLQLPAAERADRAFNGCRALEEIDVSEAGMGKCKELGAMFQFCSSLTSLDVSGWDTAACTSMPRIFTGCSSLAVLDVSRWDTAAVTDMSRAFMDCSSLTALDVSGWNTSACKDMSYIFYNCKSLSSLDVSGWDTKACTNMGTMFYNCSSLTSLDVSGWDTKACTTMSYMFYNCKSLTSLDVSGWDTAACTNIEGLFYGCSSLTALDASKWNLAACPGAITMFAGCSSLTTLDVSAWDTAALIDTRYMFNGCYALTTLRWPMMGKIKADATNNKTIALSISPLDRASLDSIFSYDRTANGLTNPLTVQLSKASKALLSDEVIAAITAKGYTIS